MIVMNWYEAALIMFVIFCAPFIFTVISDKVIEALDRARLKRQFRKHVKEISKNDKS